MIAAGESRPFVKWAGGKQSLAKTLIKHFPTRMDVYYEPFLGGGSVFFTLAPRRAVLSDENEWLIDTYRAISEDWRSVAEFLDRLPNTKDDFLRIRSIPPESLPLIERAAHFIYLNKTCFRGLFRVNKQGIFNVPYGAYDRRYYDPSELSRVAAALREATLQNCDFEMALGPISQADFVYFDPPYHKLGGYSDFNRYTATKFKEQQHLRLAAVCRELDSRGVRWALSNSDTTLVKSLYTGFKVRTIDARREINLSSQSRNIKELLITNY